MTSTTWKSSSEQSSILRQDGVRTPSILRRSAASIPGAWYRFKKRCSLAPLSALPPELQGQAELDAAAAAAAPSPGWKPFSTTAPILIPVGMSALCIAAVIECLAQRSRLHGGLALAPTPDSISRYAMMSYLYLPTILGVVFGLVWSWIDLDVKRLQPWLELSKPEGASAKNSLFLDYPYEFAAFVPFRAIGRRHWPVFLSSTVVVAISWLITPLQSSILGISTVRFSDPVSLKVRSSLIPVKEQETLIDNRPLVSGYSIGWLGQELPPWTTEKYAILPFYVEEDQGRSRPGTNWTASTKKLSTELECWPAVITPVQPGQNWWNISSGHGCTATYQLPTQLLFGVQTEYNMQYYGWEGIPHGSLALQDEPGYCPPTADSIHQFVSIWSEQTRIDRNTNETAIKLTAMFCQPQYFKQDVSITVAADTLKPYDDSIIALSPRQPLTDQEFHAQAFEFLIAHGNPKGDPLTDAPFYLNIDHQMQLLSHGFDLAPTELVAYALSGSQKDLPITAFQDPDTLQQAYNYAHQLLFSLTVGYLLANETDSSNHTAVSDYTLSGIVVSRPISVAVEILLVMAALGIFALLRFCRLATSRLQSNPSSISRHVRIFQNSQDVNQLFYSFDCYNDKSLSRLFPDDRFRLSHGAPGPHAVAIERISDGLSDLTEKIPETETQAGYYKPFRPLALRKVSGLLFILIQIGGLAAVQYLKWQETKQQGLTQPSSNFEVRQLLENFIPTIFATLTEPVLVQLNRFLCILQPFKALASGRSIAAQSINITYASFPPQLVIWRALKARHHLIAFMCAAALLSNVLAVGLGALFKEMPAAMSSVQAFRPALAPMFNDWVATSFLNPSWSDPSTSTVVSYTDHLYFALANISSGTPLLPWTTAEYFFQPQIPDGTATTSSNGSTYVVATRGFGAVANCTPTGPYFVPPSVDNAAASLMDGHCPTTQVSMDAQLRDSTPFRPINQTWTDAVEIPFTDGIGCSNHLSFAWGRIPPGTERNRTMQGSYVRCTPAFRTAMFNVTHDSQGNVISYQRTSDLSSTLDYAGSKNHTTQLLWWSNLFLDNARMPGSHNDTIARDWMNWFIVTRLNSRDVIDASKPVPDPGQLAPIVEDVYALLFAIMLSLNQALFAADTSGAVTVGARIDQSDKIFMATPAYLITTILLGLNIVAAASFYSSAPVTTLPRMPTSIGSMLAYVASSRMAQRGGPQEGGEGNRTYSFGRYMGVDKEPHLGIDVDPFVALIDPKSLKGRKTLISSWGRDDPKRKSVRDGPWI